MSAMIWDRETISKMSRLWVEGHLDEELAGRDPRFINEFHRHLAKHLASSAQTFAVEVDPDDVQFRPMESDQPFTIQERGYWSPSTHEVELRGGHKDGEVLTIKRIHDPLRVPVMSSLTLAAAPVEDMEPHSMGFDVAVYELAGWSEVDRRWVFDLRA